MRQYPPGTVPTYLDSIIATHRAAAGASERSRDDWRAAAADAPAPRDFAAALRAPDGVRVIAEIKRRSPSKGDLRPDLDPATLATQYEEGGAACLSVLTDTEYFGGSIDDLVAARAAVGIPVLRKDFTVDESDVFEARAVGADAVLLIVAALSEAELHTFMAAAAVCGIAALVEVHDHAELRRALDAGATIVGVNQRNLRTFEVDRDLAAALAPAIPSNVVKVAESGIRDAADVARLRDHGYDAVLVGESLVTAAHPAAALKELVSACS